MASWQRDYSRYKNFFLDILRVYKERPDLRAFLEIGLSLTAIIIFSVFAIRPTILTILELNKEIKNKEDISLKLNEKITNLQKAGLILQEQAENLVFLTQAVPVLAEPESFIKQIEVTATSNSVTILGLSASEVVLLGDSESKKQKDVDTLPENAGEVPITISVTGTYPNLLTFLKILENLRRPIKVDTFSINSNTTDTGKILVMIVSGRTPYLNTNKK